MKIFMSWRTRKLRKTVGKVSAAAAAASGGNNNFMHSFCLQQLQFSDDRPRTDDYQHHLYGMDEATCPETQPFDDDQHPAPLPHSSTGSHDINCLLQDMRCPINSPDSLHNKKETEKNSNTNTEMETSTKDYDMDLLIYQYTLQNALLSIGTLGGELLSDECSFLKEGIGDNERTNASNNNPISLDAVRSSKKSLKGPISGFTTSNDEVQVEMLRPCTNDEWSFLKEEVCYDATAHEEELRNQEGMVYKHIKLPANYGDSIGSAEDELRENRQFPRFMSDQDLDVNENGCSMKTNMALFIRNETNLLEDSTMDNLLKGLYIFEGTQQDPGDDEANKRWSAQRMMKKSTIGVGLCNSIKEIIGSPENVDRSMMGYSMRSSQEIMGTSTDAQEKVRFSGNSQGCGGFPLSADGILGSPGQGIKEPSSCYQGVMGSSITASHAQKIWGSSKNTGGVMGSSGSPASAHVVNTKPKGKTPEDNEEEDKYESMPTHKNCLKLASTCTHRIDLKRLIIAVTPNYVAKQFLKRLKLVHQQMQMGRSLSCNHQCKFYKQLLGMLRINQSRRASNVMKRELGPLAEVDEHAKSRTKECNIEKGEETWSSLMQTYSDEAERSISIRRTGSTSSTSMMLTSNVENWISTDDEYVVLELEGNKQVRGN